MINGCYEAFDSLPATRNAEKNELGNVRRQWSLGRPWNNCGRLEAVAAKVVMHQQGLKQKTWAHKRAGSWNCLFVLTSLCYLRLGLLKRWGGHLLLFERLEKGSNLWEELWSDEIFSSAYKDKVNTSYLISWSRAEVEGASLLWGEVSCQGRQEQTTNKSKLPTAVLVLLWIEKTKHRPGCGTDKVLPLASCLCWGILRHVSCGFWGCSRG